MKQLEVRVRSESLERVIELADRHHAFTPSHHPLEMGGQGGWHRILVNVPNERVGAMVKAVEEAVEEAEVIIPATENLPIHTPLADIRDQVVDVSSRSTLELVLDVLQSVGSWKGMLLYAVISGVVAAYGVIFNLPFLLTAAMLIAPLGAPAMVCVVAVTLGDPWMLRRGALRFVVSLLVLAGAAAVLGFGYGLTDPTEMMERLTDLSLWSALLGVAGGAAGAQALIQAERDSMVTATATGFLVAVSLSPPSAVLGLAVPLGRWDYVALMTFLIVLTFTGILVGGWAALRVQGVRPDRPSAGRGRRDIARGMVAASVLLLAGLVVWQVQREPVYQKADVVRTASQLAREAVATVPGYRVLAANARFTTGEDPDPRKALLLTVVVTETAEEETALETTWAETTAAENTAEETLRAAIRERVLGALDGVRPFVDLSVVR